MSKHETTKNTLSQLNYKIYREHWKDIAMLEEDDSRYTIALDKALDFINEIEEIWTNYKSKSNTVDLVKDLERLMESP